MLAAPVLLKFERQKNDITRDAKHQMKKFLTSIAGIVVYYTNAISPKSCSQFYISVGGLYSAKGHVLEHAEPDTNIC